MDWEESVRERSRCNPRPHLPTGRRRDPEVRVGWMHDQGWVLSRDRSAYWTISRQRLRRVTMLPLS